MRKLLNTLYITKEDYYLSSERENFVIFQGNKEIARFPNHIIEQIICFNYTGCSPSAFKLCSENKINISFLTPYGKYCGRFMGETKGNVLLRRKQYRIANSEESLDFVKNIIYAKIYNSRKVLQRASRDHGNFIDKEKIEKSIHNLEILMKDVKSANNKDSIRGVEGLASKYYFECFNEMIIKQKEDFRFESRNRRPPTDRVNALLSFLYTMLILDVQSSIEALGIDSYVGFFHTDRPGRASMALDMVEDLRAYLVDRLVLSLINLQVINDSHFETKENEAVLLNDKGRELVLKKWNEKKQQVIIHPYIEEKIKIGLIPHVQGMLFSAYMRGDIDAYPPFLIKG